MKIAVFGDVHGNLASFEAVAADIDRWRPDLVISTGDIINRGPSPAPCLERVETRRKADGWRTLRGNHEDYVIHQATSQAVRTGPKFASYYQSYWTLLRIGGDVDGIKSWDDLVEVAGPEGTVVRVAHGSASANDVGIFPHNSVEELVARGGLPSPDVFCAGHTHTAFLRRANGTLFVNAGSVGIPFDGDWRAGYARLTWFNEGWEGEVVRLEYDRDRTLKEYHESGFLAEAGPISWLVLAEYVYARSQLFSWHRDYFPLIMEGRADIESTVRDQLERQGVWEKIRTLIEKA